MKRIIIHWTAGAGQPNSTDFEHYHFLITSDGLVMNGKYLPEDNINCYDGKYAAHTGGGNTLSIGVSMCGMTGFILDKPNSTKHPLTAKQCEACFKKVAQLCKKYNIPITKETVLTHYEFGKKYPKTTSLGKIDITYLHPYPSIESSKIGDFIRNKVIWYYNRQ